jgi:hypothetical protein
MSITDTEALIMKALMFIVFLVTGSILSADIVTGVACTVDNSFGGPQSTITDPSSCLLKSPDQGPLGGPAVASATASASFSLADNPSSFSSLSVDQRANADPGRDQTGLHQLNSDATSQVSVNETLFTTGSVRSGLVQISATGSSAGDFRGSSGSLDLSLESIAVSCFGSGPTGATCVLWPNGAHTVPGYVLPVSLQYYQFTLGQAFSFSYSGSAGGNSTPSGSGDGYANLQFQFRFFEADGVTPVAVEAVPEPATFAFFGLALGAFIAGKKKFQR